jgi:flavin reductase (DIM6/NTAB) family NADH-FMN oxidoreductase RutF/DNA-binding MarR family transcriptional regulator
MNDIDARELRNCFGKFATGITVITALAPDGTKIGLTVNSFSSLSLNPPMVLWSLDKRSNSVDALKAAPYFAVNVLASDQMDLSNNFASPSDEKFVGVDLIDSEYDLPLLSETVAYLECKNSGTYEGGDHLIFIGEVVNFKIGYKKPLIYANGQYAVAARHPGTKQADPVIGEKASSDDFIIPLLLRSFWEISDPFYQELLDAGIPVAHARILVHLSHTPKLTARQIAEAIRVDMASVSMSVSWLCDNGHLTKLDNDCLILSDQGHVLLGDVQCRAERFEQEVLDGYSEEEIDLLKSMLRKLIYRKDV